MIKCKNCNETWDKTTPGYRDQLKAQENNNCIACGPKNIIVEYKGGGYDGCFWEWNFFLFDNQGTFHNLISTGYKGVKDESEAVIMVDEKAGAIYNLEDHDDMDKFQSGLNPGLLHNLIQITEDLDITPIWYRCPICEQETTETTLDPNDYRGDGGVGADYHGLYCENCFSAGTCEECNEFSPDISKNGGSYCEYCEEEKLKEITKQLDGSIYLDYDKQNNKWIPSEFDSNFDEDLILDVPEGETCFQIDVNGRQRKNYILYGIDEKNAISDLLNYLDNPEYYNLTAYELTKQYLLEGASC